MTKLRTLFDVTSERAVEVLTILNIRSRQVITKTRIINQIKGMLRSLGLNDHTVFRKASSLQKALPQIELSPFFRETFGHLCEELAAEELKIKETEKRLVFLIEQDEKLRKEYKLLQTIPGIGPITAAMCIAAIDDVNRFKKAGQLSSYFGLIPSEHSSGEKTIHGRITKEGVKEIRTLLIQAAWVLIRHKDKRTESLRKKFYRLTEHRRSSQKAITTIARHLSRIIYGVLKSGRAYCENIEQIEEQEACQE